MICIFLRYLHYRCVVVKCWHHFSYSQRFLSVFHLANPPSASALPESQRRFCCRSVWVTRHDLWAAGKLLTSNNVRGQQSDTHQTKLAPIPLHLKTPLENRTSTKYHHFSLSSKPRPLPPHVISSAILCLLHRTSYVEYEFKIIPLFCLAKISPEISTETLVRPVQCATC